MSVSHDGKNPHFESVFEQDWGRNSDATKRILKDQDGSADKNYMPGKKSTFADERGAHCDREISLAGSCEKATPLLRFLSGAIRTCGGNVLARRFDPRGGGEIEFDFARPLCVEIYCVLMAAPVALDRSSHFRFTTLCQCTRELLAGVADERVVVKLSLSPLNDKAAAKGASFEDLPAIPEPDLWES